LTSPYYDVVVVGGGINGAGVAQNAAARGYSVLVLEKNMVGAGTSSRSSKLIHGGLRYLESGQLSLVRESLRERELLLRNAPDLVKRVPFYIPVYKNAQRGAIKIRLGLTLYALIGGLGENVGFCRLSRSDWQDLDGLKTEGLRAVYQYWDAQTDDQALTQAVMNSALELGAALRLSAKFKRAVREGEYLRVAYLHKGCHHICRTAALVNAAGPWVSQVFTGMKPVISQTRIELVQGTHILIDGQIDRGIYYLEAPDDKRPVFVIPWENQIMVGATETAYKGKPSDTCPLDEEKIYLLKALSTYFPRFRATQSTKIKSAFSGLRVLPSGNGGFNSRTREVLLEVDDPNQPRFLTIYGGKLTTYRMTSKKVMDRLETSLPNRSPKADTETLRLKRDPLHLPGITSAVK